MGFDRGIAALGAAIERMSVNGALSAEEAAEIAGSLETNLGPEVAMFAPALADLGDRLRDRG